MTAARLSMGDTDEDMTSGRRDIIQVAALARTASEWTMIR